MNSESEEQCQAQPANCSGPIRARERPRRRAGCGNRTGVVAARATPGARLANTRRGLFRQDRAGRGAGGVAQLAERCCELVDSRLRRYPPDRASAVPFGQAGENALRFPHLAHRSAAAHRLHSATTPARIEFDSGNGETFNRLSALAYSSRNLSRRSGPPQPGVRQHYRRDVGSNGGRRISSG